MTLVKCSYVIQLQFIRLWQEQWEGHLSIFHYVELEFAIGMKGSFVQDNVALGGRLLACNLPPKIGVNVINCGVTKGVPTPKSPKECPHIRVTKGSVPTAELPKGVSPHQSYQRWCPQTRVTKGTVPHPSPRGVVACPEQRQFPWSYFTLFDGTVVSPFLTLTKSPQMFFEIIYMPLFWFLCCPHQLLQRNHGILDNFF